MKLIVGLGNPGLTYRNTRHNIGFIVIDNFERTLLNTQISTDEKMKIFKPHSFMNNSGVAVKRAIAKTGAPLKDLLVVCDDINLKLGIIRFRASGSAGGHRGLQSIIDALGTEGFNRLRIGIGVEKKAILRDYVLSKFRPAERKVLEEVLDRAIEGVKVWIDEGVEAAMNKYNAKNLKS